MGSRDFRLASQQRLIEAMENTTDEPRAEYAREMVTSTQLLSEAVIDRFLPETDAAIYSRSRMRDLLREFTDELAQQQAEWLARWQSAKTK